MTPLVELVDVTKRFGSVVAVSDVSASASEGEVTCILGDNGAGKSTLIKILAGVYRPTEGRVLVDGDEVSFASPRDAIASGIATVYQDLALIPLMSVWRNFFLGFEPTKGRGVLRRLDITFARAKVQEELDALGIAIPDPDRPVGKLSGGERQSVAIARALYHGARVLILDEPTSALGVRQSAQVLHTILAARERGLAVILITHNPNHAFPVGDRFVILRRGRSLGTFPKQDVTLEAITRLMAGRLDLESPGAGRA